MSEAPIRLADTESSSSNHSYANEYGLVFDEMREEEVQEEGQDRNIQRKDKTDAFCNVCLMHNLIGLSKNVAFYLCYVCEQYLCNKCFNGHESHECIKFVSEKSERDGQIDIFCDEMINECEREKKFARENVSMVDSFNVKHGFDQKDCRITGICGLNYTRWVVSDYKNGCIKIFNVGSNLLQRCIRFGSRPWGVTEQVVMTTSDISVSNRAEPLQSLLAVTLPLTHRILIIDVKQNPAVITKTIKTETQCFSIDFSGDNIVTVCNDGVYDHGYQWFVSVMFTDGVTIKTINTDLHSWSHPSLAVCHGRFYITETNKNKVLCLNDEGNVVSQKTIALSWPYGISVDPDTNHVYICSRGHGKLFRLNSSLESLEPLFDFKSVNSRMPNALCLYRDKLFVGHSPESTYGNFVSVVRVL